MNIRTMLSICLDMPGGPFESFVECPNCKGSGKKWFRKCRKCNGEGWIGIPLKN